MKAVLILLVTVGVALGQQYTDKYDNIDLDQILRSERLLANYVNCLLDKGKCTPDGAELKKHLSEALANNCSKCTDRQRAGSRKVLHHILATHRDWWSQLEAKYDPQGNYRKRYEAELKAEGIQI
ncbi:ejaculatory bulb-specific protein 3 [Aethina tumida]|uniref:ejaculatory bulb-specific protein 3 n=1 Tax=Aethina tumida TaxID=116153 RepID=UPI00096B57BC|nr:ejaculatory bulb-specific protein 3 [Aethina tumida]